MSFQLFRIVVVAGLLSLSHSVWAISGIEGTFEFAFDAPWRIEPSTLANGEVDYGQIPLQLTIHDANITMLDRGERISIVNGHAEIVPAPGPLRLGAFCKLSVIHRPPLGSPSRRDYAFSDLAEIERTGGPWRDRGFDSEPTNRTVCRQDQGESCADLATISGSSEWYGLAWYPVPPSARPGDKLALELEVVVNRNPYESCAATDPDQRITLRNHVSVELGQAPLPRFGSGWVYGDLHYHSQGTDNEGEAGHNYRGVVRAMGAMGLDFAFATEHASASDQVIDADMWTEWQVEIHARETRGTLRDMNDQRFRTLLGDLQAPGGANVDAAIRGEGGRDPQTVRVNGTVPQIYLGGEVDVIPEVAQGFPNYLIPVGNGISYDVGNLCGGWSPSFSGWGPCSLEARYEEASNGFLMRDIQGVNQTHYARLHLVYLPRSSSDSAAFVPSYTGPFGGATRRLAEAHRGRGPIGPEMRDHGYAFIAHPMSGLGGGGKGPDTMPWTDHMLAKAFAEPAILGLQLWNEDSRFDHKLQSGELKGYERPDSIWFEKAPVEAIREGFYSGLFELDARAFLSGESRERADLEERRLLDTIAHGTYAWDRMNLWGLDPSRTEALGWLDAGEPRRLFMAGGSDAHGDFNYRREGYFLGDTKLTDTAMGTPRNLVDVGLLMSAPGGASTGTVTLGESGEGEDSGGVQTSASTSVLLASEWTMASFDVPSSPTSAFDAPYVAGETIGETGATPDPVTRRIQQHTVVDALADGRFAVTDGPALRIAIDRNRDGSFDSGDTPMGGIVDLYGEEELPLLIQWKSTADFGPVQRIDIIVGSASGSERRLYGPSLHGARGLGLSFPSPVESYFDYWEYERGADDYWRVDGQSLVVGIPNGAPWENTASVTLDLRALVAAPGVDGERFFVRAVARTNGQVARYAYTNPVWALQRDTATCPVDAPRALDGDGDGLPDGCDPCPTSSSAYHACHGGGGETTLAETPSGSSDGEQDQGTTSPWPTTGSLSIDSSSSFPYTTTRSTAATGRLR